jgi:hypothetical protein
MQGLAGCMPLLYPAGGVQSARVLAMYVKFVVLYELENM